jgi:flagellar hook-length control protein FliK
MVTFGSQLSVAANLAPLSGVQCTAPGPKSVQNNEAAQFRNSSFKEAINNKAKNTHDGVKQTEVQIKDPIMANDGSQRQLDDARARKGQADFNLNNDEQNLTKPAAISAFLDKMQAELGVSPADILKAFSELDADSLMVAPEVSADEFIGALNLPQDKKERAFEIYSELLTWTAAAGLAENLTEQNTSAEFEVLNQEQAGQRTRLQSLKTMSDKFFVDNKEKSLKMTAVAAAAVATKAAPSEQGIENLKLTTHESSSSAPAVSSAPASNVDKNSIDSLLQNALVTEDGPAPNFTPMSNEFMAAEGQQELPIAAFAKTAPHVDTLESLLMQTRGTNQNPSAILANTDTSAQSSQAIIGFSAEGALSDSSQDDTSSSEAQNEFLLQNGDSIKKQELEIKPFVIKAPVPTEAENQNNVRDIITGAQAMIKNGGGEVKMKLQPEGLGEVHLKVNVQDGDVKVEMITTSDEARKVLEKGLQELKHSLASHKLNVETIKVESMQQSSQMNLESDQQSAERNFQQRFLSDFRQNNERMRNDIMGIGPMRRPSSQTIEDAANAIINTNSKRKADARRLDLVA